MKQIIPLVIGVFIAAGPAHAQTAPLIHEEVLEGPYTQGWYALPLEQDTPDSHRVYLRGEGKRGDFTGVLYVHCEVPKYSNWVATGGYLTPQDVPAEAVVALRDMVCD